MSAVEKSKMAGERHAFVIRRFLLSGAAIQDSLLQSYRGLFLGTHAALVTVAALLIRTNAGSRVGAILCAVGVTAVAGIAWFCGAKLKTVIEHRAKCVSWWHVALLLHENSHSVSDYFGRFKRNCERVRAAKFGASEANDTDVDALIDTIVSKGNEGSVTKRTREEVKNAVHGSETRSRTKIMRVLRMVFLLTWITIILIAWGLYYVASTDSASVSSGVSALSYGFVGVA